METWKQLSEDSFLAAEALFREGRYRSCISRAYYAAYCAATHEIVRKLTTFSHSRQNPSHEKVPTYITNNLTIPLARRQTADTLFHILRLFREDADYRPHILVDEQMARGCIRNALAIRRALWGTTR